MKREKRNTSTALEESPAISTRAEERKVEERLAIGPHIVYETIRREGEEEFKRSSAALAWSGLAACRWLRFWATHRWWRAKKHSCKRSDHVLRPARSGLRSGDFRLVSGPAFAISFACEQPWPRPARGGERHLPPSSLHSARARKGRENGPDRARLGRATVASGLRGVSIPQHESRGRVGRR
jgi:hypothetical protein